MVYNKGHNLTNFEIRNSSDGQATAEKSRTIKILANNAGASKDKDFDNISPSKKGNK